MVGIITQSTHLNSFWSVGTCLLALCLHAYTSYLTAMRYQGATTRAWPGPPSRAGLPCEVNSLLTLLVLAQLCMPCFVIASFLRVGNYGNDGVKLGRDHALNPHLDAACKRVKSRLVRRVWRNCVPLAPTFYLSAAFFLLLPDTLLQAVEVEFGYRTTGECR